MTESVIKYGYSILRNAPIVLTRRSCNSYALYEGSQDCTEFTEIENVQRGKDFSLLDAHFIQEQGSPIVFDLSVNDVANILNYFNTTKDGGNKC